MQLKLKPFATLGFFVLAGVAFGIAPAAFGQLGGGVGFNSGLPSALGGGPTASAFGVIPPNVPPAISSCGTSPAVTYGNNAFGVVVGGTATPTSCTLTWQSSLPAGLTATPRLSALGGCIVFGRNTPVTGVTTDNASTLTWTFAATNSAVFVYICPQS